ncbi:SAM-dependent methyltransferase [Micromonospora tarensis]|uniref:SAM-dependent methyltransferase n=1 Tax=Micromonospora tarensis TaxID=2806100 RepID=A0ABS1YEI5_9ACTN|nr:SAM-dependent methyltransferase [Micromonospora tarensis]MBM0275626.1 SAM-dependent methyltransferase [Micromonospora tarensis]
MPIPWREAMSQALYGPDGFFVAGTGPAAHFRTSVHASPAFASALVRLIAQVDAALDHPPRLDVVDVGAGRGELLRSLLRLVASSAAVGDAVGDDPSSVADRPSLVERVRFTAVELAPRPEHLPEPIEWVSEIPAGITGLLTATEWLDNVPLDVAVHTRDGWRYLLVDPESGAETVGELVSAADSDWLTQWWPRASDSAAAGSDPDLALTWTDGTSETPHSDHRAEIGRPRDEAWADAVRQISRGLAVAVDYGHLRRDRPVDGTLTGYRSGRQVAPVPDGTTDVTAHVAMDSVASAGAAAARCAYSLVSQREALRALGADGRRPPLGLAGTDPAGYLRALAAASAVAELTDPAGLGGHWWLRQPVGIPLEPAVAR